MRVRISHQTTYAYATPARSVIQTLRLTPRSHESQRVSDWRIDVNVNCRLVASEDAFGNITHTFTADGPLPNMTISVDGEVETFDAAGVARGCVEKFPPELYLRETALTTADSALREFALDVASRGESIERLHALMAAVSARMTFDADPTHSGTTAAEAFALGRGVCQDFAHVFIACARHLDIPARYVSGYFLRTDGVLNQDAGHAWAETWIENLGWVGFDCANDICPREQHVRIACALDYLGAAPVRGSRNGGGDETMRVAVHVSQSQSQSQSQG